MACPYTEDILHREGHSCQETGIFACLDLAVYFASLLAGAFRGDGDKGVHRVCVFRALRTRIDRARASIDCRAALQNGIQDFFGRYGSLAYQSADLLGRKVR
jgi:hypothetical protein